MVDDEKVEAELLFPAATPHCDLRQRERRLLLDGERQSTEIILSVAQKREIVIRNSATTPQITVRNAPAATAQFECQRGQRPLSQRHGRHFKRAIHDMSARLGRIQSN